MEPYISWKTTQIILIIQKEENGKITYIDENDGQNETEIFKISKQDIAAILDLAKQGTEKNEKTSEEIYVVYKIETNGKTVFVDSEADKENTISKLFIY